MENHKADLDCIKMLKRFEDILPRIISDYENIKRQLDKVAKERRDLLNENTILKRRIVGLETQVNNLKEKEEKRYRNDDY